MSEATNDERLNAAKGFSIAAAVLLFLGAFSVYWVFAHLWVFALAVFVPGLIAYTAALIISLLILIRSRRAKDYVPLALNAATIAAFLLLPWSEFSMRIDFMMKKPAMERIALLNQLERPTVMIRDSNGELMNSEFGEKALAKGDRWLSIDGNMHFIPADCGSYIFFPSAFAVPDGASGFLFVPECAAPEDFSGASWGAKWFNISPLGGRWFRMDGT